jgi:hypothetical protein
MFVDNDELEQFSQHLIGGAMGPFRRLGQRSVSLFDKRTLNSAKLVVARH